MVRKISGLGLLAAIISCGAVSAQNTSSATSATSSITTGSTTTTVGTPASASTTTSVTTTTAPSATTTPAQTTTTVTTTGSPSGGAATTTVTTTTATKPNYALTLQNACHSESIVMAEYLGYEKGEIHFNNPPLANYHITKILKGPPLNKSIPIKYEFHDHSNPPAPKGWKFSDSDMPKKGSKWILFIKYAVPHNDMFETYEGSYGRQEASEENLNAVYDLLNAHNEMEERQ